MMRKAVISIFILAMFVLGNTLYVRGSNFETEEVNFAFSPPHLHNGVNYVTFSDASNSLSSAGYPVMPYESKVMTFPFGTKIKGIDVSIGDVQTIHLDKKIAPAPEAVPLNGAEPKAAQEGEIYQSNEPYPSNWVEWSAGAGLEDGKHVVFLTIRAFPARYLPASNEIEYVNDMSIEVRYTPPSESLLTNDVYDLLIIAPSEFTDTLQPLVDHKNSHGMRTIMVTLDEIYNSNYFPVQGRDGAEKMKYFIKDSIEEWGIKYVLLVGGKKSYITGNWGYDGPTKVDDSLWWVPVRYAALDDQAEKGYVSDFYFADIYDAGGNFSSWDTNGDGIYAAWSFKYGKDPIDGYPDVYVG
ncbi:MAG TPA: hypothetical protein ENL18_00770, partial [Thermoplasmatales archaeon]|nr:hypothetical protein [Thermoplasmatales archaeon]